MAAEKRFAIVTNPPPAPRVTAGSAASPAPPAARTPARRREGGTGRDNSGIKCTCSKFEDDTKLSGGVATPEGWDGIQRDLDKLEKWVHGNLMMFNKTKSKVLLLDQGKSWYEPRLEDEQIQSSPAQDLGVLEWLDMTQPWALPAQRTKCVLGCIQISVGSRGGRGFCPSALLW
ncbi:uncharacterized protein LOC143694649 [Agelaius phoeniceus]|uniref:uncharacterized protein LOC143694649 n=1 Tax=Agelaius phoeniceus TaxID=39638 RepID=UPI004054E7A9